MYWKWRERVSSGGGKIVDILLSISRFVFPFSFSVSLPISTQMAEIETLGILQDIESLVADKLQVVTTSLEFLFSSFVTILYHVSIESPLYYSNFVNYFLRNV